MIFNPSEKLKKNGLSISLTESAVFLPTDGPSGRPHRNAELRSSLVRGLLVLELAKPTKITSIELELVAKASTAWPEGVGARRVEVAEQHRAYSASTVYFKANSLTPTTRRAASIGPGASLNNDDPTLDWDEDELDDPLFRPPLTRSGLVANGIPSVDAQSGVPGPSNVTNATRERTLLPDPGLIRAGRRRTTHLSPPYSPVDPSSPAAMVSLTSLNSLHPTPELENTPPRSRQAQQNLEEFRAELHSTLRNPRSSSRSSSLSTRPIERSLSRRPSMSDVPEDAQLHHPSAASPVPHPPSIAPSLTQSLATSISTPPSGSENRSFPDNTALSTLNLNDSASSIPQGPPLTSTFSANPPGDDHGHVEYPRGANRNSSGSRERSGRRHSRFSLTAVADAFLEVVGANPPIPNKIGRTSKERGESHRRGDILGSRSRDPSTDGRPRSTSRGRRMERSVAFAEDEINASVIPAHTGSALASPLQDPEHSPLATFPRKANSRTRESPTRVFGQGADEVREKKDTGDGWKEFKKGTYTYPISFSIPTTAPPTLQCDYGSVVWKLSAHVHRPGTFKTKYTATREVQVIACPTEEDTEDTENIIVERHWDQQLQYLISISGRSFYIGGTVPVTFAFMPLAKIKVHRILMFIEEKVDYYNNMRRVVRSDPITRFHLLSVKHEGKHQSHILPLDSDDANALKNSPLYPLISPEEDESEVASQLMGPGPWSFHQELKLPASCGAMHFTNKNRRANITVSHVLKVVLRVERGDDSFVDKNGKRKLFDIVIQTPVHILSCRCNPEWISLPRYEEAFTSSDYIIPNCPCQVKRLVSQSVPPAEFHVGPFHGHIPAALDRIKHHPHSDSKPHDPSEHGKSPEVRPSSSSLHHAEPHVQAIHASDTSPIDTSMMPSLRQLISTQNPQNAQMLRSSQQYQRLVAGFESEFGEAPPAYDLTSSPGSSPPSSSNSSIVVAS